ncbi:hypothetical protein [Streptomyces sp. NPDC004284]|uniref:hypothetical protein n=1 Tax=Streptomyces sp. NPDC004284 TaxID=3364695 RepID=UPI00369467E7
MSSHRAGAPASSSRTIASPRTGSGVGTAVVGLLAAGGAPSLTGSRSVEEHTMEGAV